jgi:hypothetical protein
MFLIAHFGIHVAYIDIIRQKTLLAMTSNEEIGQGEDKIPLPFVEEVH